MTRPPIERRVTPWISVESHPEWAGSSIAAYRIWIEFDGRHWYQMHEWENRHGNRERWADGWINGLRGWPANAFPTDEEPPILQPRGETLPGEGQTRRFGTVYLDEFQAGNFTVHVEGASTERFASLEALVEIWSVD